MPKVFVSWSSGKDSAFALHRARQQGFEIAGVLTTINEVYDRVAMHGVRQALLDRQIAALGLPALKVFLPNPCPNAVYEERMEEACARMRDDGVTRIVFGDLFLEDIRGYRIEKLASAGMEPVFPLWGLNTSVLARQMIEEGLVAYLTCIDGKKLPKAFAGRRFDKCLLDDLPKGTDPCGENGEFHTVVTAGPMFSAPIAVCRGEIAEREGFVFADFLPQD